MLGHWRLFDEREELKVVGVRNALLQVVDQSVVSHASRCCVVAPVLRLAQKEHVTFQMPLLNHCLCRLRLRFVRVFFRGLDVEKRVEGMTK